MQRLPFVQSPDRFCGVLRDFSCKHAPIVVPVNDVADPLRTFRLNRNRCSNQSVHLWLGPVMKVHFLLTSVLVTV